MSAPVRVQRKRTKGYRLPPDAIYVGRPTGWGNPFRVGDYWLGERMDAREATRRFSLMAEDYRLTSPGWLEALRRKDLACWCPLDQPCHADVLLELANA